MNNELVASPCAQLFPYEIEHKQSDSSSSTVTPCVTLICGAYWGDEGKGRITAFEAMDADFVLRTTGGNNAGHTVYYNGDKIPLHLIPGGIMSPHVTTTIICSGVVVNPKVLYEEIQLLSKYIKITPDNFIVSGRAHIIMPYHIDLDKMYEEWRGNAKIGTTLRGIGPCYSDKANRIGITMQDVFRDEQSLRNLLASAIKFHFYNLDSIDKHYTINELFEYCIWIRENLGQYIQPQENIISTALRLGSKIVIEGAQADHLDLEVGDYPNCTSSYCNPAGSLSAAGIGCNYAKKVIAVMKAYCSRVGNGPFPTELKGDEAEIIREFGHEYGTTTGRPRRCGWLDLCALSKDRGYTDICLNHLDTIGLIGQKLGYIKVCTGYLYQGKEIDYFPSNIEVTGEVPQPIYETFEGGWEISEVCECFEDLPKKAQDFVTFIELFTGMLITYIGIGPRNEDTIVR